MSYRVMRMIVFFDLPTYTRNNLLDYRNFRRFLLKNGFIMMQESVYSKLVLNNNSTKLLSAQIKKNLPRAGLVQMLIITEKQYAGIEYLMGKSKSNVIETMERVVQIWNLCMKKLKDI